MPPRDPRKVQLDFPQLTADLIGQLKLVGTVGLLDFSPEVVPVFIVGDRDLSVDATPPVFSSPQIFHDSDASPLANATLLDTGQLPAGTYDIFAQISFLGSIAASGVGFHLRHRNAADSGTLATLIEVMPDTVSSNGGENFPLIGYEIAENERLRWISADQLFSGQVATTIAAAIRPIP